MAQGHPLGGRGADPSPAPLSSWHPAQDRVTHRAGTCFNLLQDPDDCRPPVTQDPGQVHLCPIPLTECPFQGPTSTSTFFHTYFLILINLLKGFHSRSEFPKMYSEELYPM